MFSQYDEEKYILEALKGIEPKDKWQFLDIGAWDPKTFSNTRAMVDLGWSGIFIEPSPGPSLNLIKEYGYNFSKFVVIQAAVDLKDRLVPLHVTDDAVTTSGDAEYEKWKATAKFHGMVMVPSITLEEIANQFGGFDFVNFDAEGVSVDLFKRAMEIGWRPRCCCVEHDGRLTELLAGAPAYNAVYTNETNVVLVTK